ncbi:unnamed protein product [Camellia sinensis]
MELGRTTSAFIRMIQKSVDVPYDSAVFRVPSGYNAPQQVHITQGDHVGKAVIVSWVTDDEPGSNDLLYWSSENIYHKNKAKGTVGRYKFYNYTSGYIHHCTLKNFSYNSKYYYEVGIGHTRTFWFMTPPEVGPDAPYTFGLIGNHELDFVPELGQTEPFKPDIMSLIRPPIVPLLFGTQSRELQPASLSCLPIQHIYVNRSETPWLIVLMHSPWYNSNKYYYIEGETVRVMLEPWFVHYKVDVVFAGHVHAYERS